MAWLLAPLLILAGATALQGQSNPSASDTGPAWTVSFGAGASSRVPYEGLGWPVLVGAVGRPLSSRVHGGIEVGVRRTVFRVGCASGPCVIERWRPSVGLVGRLWLSGEETYYWVGQVGITDLDPSPMIEFGSGRRLAGGNGLDIDVDGRLRLGGEIGGVDFAVMVHARGDWLAGWGT